MGLSSRSCCENCQLYLKKTPKNSLQIFLVCRHMEYSASFFSSFYFFLSSSFIPELIKKKLLKTRMMNTFQSSKAHWCDHLLTSQVLQMSSTPNPIPWKWKYCSHDSVTQNANQNSILFLNFNRILSSPSPIFLFIVGFRVTSSFSQMTIPLKF